MESDNHYLNRRAEEELEAADKSPDPKVREIHAELAARYREAVDGEAPLHREDEPQSGLLPDEFRILE